MLRLAGAAISCEIELNGTILLDRACEGTVKLDGMALPCDDPDGWVPTDERHLRLQGRACEQLRASKDGLVEADFACTGFRPT
ncbi:MAG TPA: hypothetical protein VJV78_06910 [Polyangiales bacterium]|nr:hypothetical protein [Polyangiales bacterium]